MAEFELKSRGGGGVGAWTLTVISFQKSPRESFFICRNVTVRHTTLGIKRNEKKPEKRGKNFHALLDRNQRISCFNLAVTNKRIESV